MFPKSNGSVLRSWRGELNTKHNGSVKKKKSLKDFSGTLLERDTETESKKERD